MCGGGGGTHECEVFKSVEGLVGHENSYVMDMC